MTTGNLILILSCTAIIPVICFIGCLIYLSRVNFNKKEEKNDNHVYLSFDEVNEIIDTTIDEILVNKWKVYYRLKDIRIIPKMDQDIATITKEIITAFSPVFLESVEYYYTKEFFYTMITRRVQLFLINYTNEYKPPVK